MIDDQELIDYLVGLLATASLRRQPGGKIIHDPRLTWNTLEVVEAAGGVVTDWNGRDTIYGQGCVSTNAALRSQVVQQLHRK